MAGKIEISKQSIEAMLGICNFERAKTARRLGVSPPTFAKLVEQHGIILAPSPRHHSLPKEHWEAALEASDGDVLSAANALGISTQTMRKHMRRHKLGEYVNG